MSTSIETMRPVRGTPVRGTAAFAAEWTKLWTLRATRACMLISVGIAVAAAALFCLTLGATTGIPLAERPVWQVVTTSMLGADAASLVLLVTTAGTVGSEYSNGMIRTTLTATPRRGRFLLGKASAIGVGTLVTALVAALGAFGAGQLIVLVSGLPTASIADPDVFRLIFGSALMAPMYALAAISFAIAFRSTAGGIVGALVLLFLPTLASWMPAPVRETVRPYLMGEALHSLSGITPPEAVHSSPPLVAVLVLAAWMVALLALAYALLTRRDA